MNEYENFILEETSKAAFVIYRSGKNKGDEQADWEEAKREVLHKYKRLHWAHQDDMEHALSNAMPGALLH
jgi:hypothetical protein